MEFCGQPYAKTNEEAEARMKKNPNIWSAHMGATTFQFRQNHNMFAIATTSVLSIISENSKQIYASTECFKTKK